MREYTIHHGTDNPVVCLTLVGFFCDQIPAEFAEFVDSPLGISWNPAHPAPQWQHRSKTDRVLWVPLQHAKDYGVRIFRKQWTEALSLLAKTPMGLQELQIVLDSFVLPDASGSGVTVCDLVPHAIELLEAACYAFQRFKSSKPNGKPEKPHWAKMLKTVHVRVKDRSLCAQDALQSAVHYACAVSKSMELMKDTANLPPNVCTPEYMAEQAVAVAQAFPETLSVTVLSETDMQKLGMGAFLGVAQASTLPPKLVIAEYRPPHTAADTKPVVLVGKGVTFDSGGLSLKPSSAMLGMKYDMSGAAAVLGVLQGVAQYQLPFPVVGILALAENMVAGNALRVGDIVTTMSGQTVEITNTDAEGRLLLCDALTYAERFKPACVVDMATLTGACVVALGKHASGLLGNDKALLQSLEQAGERSADRVWPLPLWEEYQPLLDSTVADMINCRVGDGEAGTITAACFLARFTANYRWAHLDIAGTAVSGYDKTGLSTGRPIPLLMDWLRHGAACAGDGQ